MSVFPNVYVHYMRIQWPIKYFRGFNLMESHSQGRYSLCVRVCERTHIAGVSHFSTLYSVQLDFAFCNCYIYTYYYWALKMRINISSEVIQWVDVPSTSLTRSLYKYKLLALNKLIIIRNNIYLYSFACLIFIGICWQLNISILYYYINDCRADDDEWDNILALYNFYWIWMRAFLCVFMVCVFWLSHDGLIIILFSS